jgi:small subunit ribosomal protein S8
MSMSDPIADMLTRIRNAQAAGHKAAMMPHSAIKTEVARVLKDEGYILDFAIEGDIKKTLSLFLKYGPGRLPVIRGLQRESRCGLRRYSKAEDLPRVLGGLGTSVVSTSKGVMSGKRARRENIGGEIICSVW